MTSLPTADLVLDCRGALCPMPVIKLRDLMASAEPGQVIHVIATDPASVHDMPAYSRNTGNELMESVSGNKLFEFYFRKSEAPE